MKLKSPSSIVGVSMFVRSVCIVLSSVICGCSELGKCVSSIVNCVSLCMKDACRMCSVSVWMCVRRVLCAYSITSVLFVLYNAWCCVMCFCV